MALRPQPGERQRRLDEGRFFKADFLAAQDPFGGTAVVRGRDRGASKWCGKQTLTASHADYRLQPARVVALPPAACKLL
jgi:hypothetical protein